MAKFGVAVVVLLALVQLYLAQECNKCMTNNVSCESESEYYVCMGDKRLGPNYCEADEVCTNSPNVCEKKENVKDTIVNVCGENNGKCQACAEGMAFTCASRTQFALCSGTTMNEKTIIDCENDEICIVEAGVVYENICVPQCAAKFFGYSVSCSNAAYTPSTVEPPTTPGPAAIQSICTEAAVGKTSNYFFTYADSTCSSYVYCERKSTSDIYFSNTFTGSCTSPKIYFNTANGQCQTTRPASCKTT